MNNTAVFTFWDVQHGSACHINTPNGQHIAIDLGVGDISSTDESRSPLTYLKNFGVQSLDAVIITHQHTDHLDDIFAFQELNPRILLRPKHLTEKEIRDANQSKDSKILNKYFEIEKTYSQPANAATNTLVSQVNGGLAFQSFHPFRCPKSNLNNHSIVSVFSFAGSKILIPGDNESPSWEELLKDNDFLNAIKGTDILVAAHHGREAGYCEALFQHITPKLTIISDGPFVDTSATSKYCAKTSGWKVHYADGTAEQRQCVTTREDGTIQVQLGFNSGGKPYIYVSTEN